MGGLREREQVREQQLRGFSFRRRLLLSAVQSRLPELADCRPALSHAEVPAVFSQRRSLRVPPVGPGLLQRQQAAQLQELPAARRHGARRRHCGMVRRRPVQVVVAVTPFSALLCRGAALSPPGTRAAAPSRLYGSSWSLRSRRSFGASSSPWVELHLYATSSQTPPVRTHSSGSPAHAPPRHASDLSPFLPRTDIPAGKFDVVVTDHACPPPLENNMASQQVPLVSPEWLIQSVICGERLGFHSLPQYRHDYTS